MASQTAAFEDEFESELESELETEYESEWEFEDESEWEEEAEFEDESEWESEEFFPGLGGVVNAVGGLLGEEEYEWEDEGEEEDEGEAFLGLLGPLARVAGNLLGGDGGTSMRTSTRRRPRPRRSSRSSRAFSARPRRSSRRWRRRLARSSRPQSAVPQRVLSPVPSRPSSRASTSRSWRPSSRRWRRQPLAPSQVFAEYLAAQAAATESESEAEALSGAAAFAAINPDDRRELERLLPHLLREPRRSPGCCTATVEPVPRFGWFPGITDGTARTIAQRVAAGAPVGPVELGRVMGAATAQALTPGGARQAVLRRHAPGLARARRRYHGPRRRAGKGRRTAGVRYPRPRGGSPIRRLGRPGTVRRQPTRSRTVGGGRVSRPRPGFVRITTPVRVPPKAGRPARVVRVVSDVRVPRGATPAGRPTSTSGRRAR